MPRRKKSFNEDDTTEIADGNEFGEEKEVRSGAVANSSEDESEDDDEVSLEELAEEELEEETE